MIQRTAAKTISGRNAPKKYPSASGNLIGRSSESAPLFSVVLSIYSGEVFFAHRFLPANEHSGRNAQIHVGYASFRKNSAFLRVPKYERGNLSFIGSIEREYEPRSGIERHVDFLLEPEERELRNRYSRKRFLDGVPQSYDSCHRFFAHSFAIVEESCLGEIGVDDVDFRKFGISGFRVHQDSVSGYSVIPFEFRKIRDEFRRPGRQDDFEPVRVQPRNFGFANIFLHRDYRS